MCKCPRGMTGDGFNFPEPGNPFRGCSSTSWALRFRLTGALSLPPDSVSPSPLGAVSGAKVLNNFDDIAPEFGYFLGLQGDKMPSDSVFNSMNHDIMGDTMTINVFWGRNEGNIASAYDGLIEATAAEDYFLQNFGPDSDPFNDSDNKVPAAPQSWTDAGGPTAPQALPGTKTFKVFSSGNGDGVTLDSNSYTGLYTFTLGLTSDYLEIKPTGLEVETVVFQPVCEEVGSQSGCWKVQVVFTIGEKNFNTFYLPRAEHPGFQQAEPYALPIDPNYDYSTIVYNNWGGATVEDSFVQRNFPCTSDDYDSATDGIGNAPPTRVSTCCLKPFVEMYRPVKKFADLARTYSVFTDYPTSCVDSSGDATSTEPDGGVTPKFRAFDSTVTGDNIETNGVITYELPQHYIGADPWLEGVFDGMSESAVHGLQTVDGPLGVYRAFVYLDDLEVRSLAGKLTGTIGADYSVETFIGLADFKPTENLVLDSASKQWPMTLSKTNYFSVSSHGQNDYTFLSYVNMRLVEVYAYDSTLAADSEDVAFTRADNASAAQYVQVTFTLDKDTYQPDSMLGETNGSPTVIPLSSVRVGQGVFFNDQDMEHSCTDWVAGSGEFAGTNKGTFDGRFSNTIPCAPDAVMCSNPTTIPNQFVSFNVPLGLDWLPGTSDMLASNVFVDLVVTVEINNPTAPANDIAEQMKTRLTGSIPVVDGGTNIFCDAIVAKLDLADIANVHLTVGIAKDVSEWTKITEFNDIATSMMVDTPPSYFETASIESGLMTLVLDGNDDFFASSTAPSSNRLAASFALQLEDVFTIHIMEPTAGWGDGTKAKAVQDLVERPGDDNYDGNTLDLDGYNLNGAFKFTITDDYATLQPTSDLLDECSFRAEPVDGDVLFPETCILRRDMSHRALTENTFEITTATATADTAGVFMQTILGQNDYSKTLGSGFASTIMTKYSINGRYKRAFWINPGYEWTPAQTAGGAKFSLTQKLFFFALVKLDESFGTTSRRRLLQSTAQGKVEVQEGMNSQRLEYESTQATILAQALDYPEGRVTSWSTEMALTALQVCMPRAELAPILRSNMMGLLDKHASTIKDVFVTSLSVNPNGVQCRRSLDRSLLAQSDLSAATATMEAMIVFDLAEETMAIDMESLNADPLIVRPLASTDAKGAQIVDGIPDDGKTDDDKNTIDDKKEEPADEEDDSGSSNNIGPIVGGIVGGLAVFAMIGFGVWKYSKGGSGQEVEVGTAVNDDLMNQLKEAGAQPQPPAQGVPAGAPKMESVF